MPTLPVLGDADVRLVSGFTTIREPDMLAARPDTLRRHVRQLPLGALVVHEDAGFHVPALSALVRERLLDAVDLYGMNEDEMQGCVGQGLDPLDAAGLLDGGMVSLPDAVASVEDVTRARGERLLLVRTAGGLAVDVLPDRGLDLGAVWWGGVPVAWRSPNPVDPGPGWGWEERFRGGLLATCGPDNIGEPRGGSGQHGTHHLTPAYDVRWWRELTAAAIEVHVTGSVPHTSLGGSRVVVERHVVVRTGEPWVHVHDVVRNVGDRPAAVPLLYHVNLGAPLLAPGARLQVPYGEHVTREPLPAGRHPLELPSPGAGLEPVVAEHRVPTTTTDRYQAVLTGTGAGVEVVVEWPAATLPRLNTWNWPAERAWVLGVEPSNAPLFGPERDEPGAGAPVLEPGASWETGVSVGLRTAAPQR